MQILAGHDLGDQNPESGQKMRRHPTSHACDPETSGQLSFREIKTKKTAHAPSTQTGHEQRLPLQHNSVGHERHVWLIFLQQFPDRIGRHARATKRATIQLAMQNRISLRRTDLVSQCPSSLLGGLRLTPLCH
jgi:hypothetical protein